MRENPPCSFAIGCELGGGGVFMRKSARSEDGVLRECVASRGDGFWLARDPGLRCRVTWEA